jgi:hypothetical protein
MSSMITATLGSTPIEKANVPMPRRMIELFGDVVVCVMVSAGAAPGQIGKSDSRALAIASLDSAVTAAGTDWRFCSRFCAVTTISSSPAGLAPASAACSAVGSLLAWLPAPGPAVKAPWRKARQAGKTCASWHSPRIGLPFWPDQLFVLVIYVNPSHKTNRPDPLSHIRAGRSARHAPSGAGWFSHIGICRLLA